MPKKKVKYKLGGADVVWSETMLIPDGVKVDFSIIVEDDDTLPVSITFNTESIEDGSRPPMMRGSAVDGGLLMEFINFDGNFSHSGLALPQPIGTTNSGTPIYFLANINKLPGSRKIDLQFLVGEVVLGG